MRHAGTERVEATGDSSRGSLVGRRYQLQEIVGRGGMGTVYRALDRLGGAIALKRLHRSVMDLELEASPDSTTATLSRETALDLAAEFKALTSLRHPHVIHVLDYGFDEELRPYLTMELLAGAKTLVEAGRGQPPMVQIDLLVQLLQALAYMHRRGFIHRDLKPGNVLVVDGQVKVLDFGLALARERGEARGVSGTRGYIAPELFQGEPASESSDLYSVGVMAQRMVVGARAPEPRLVEILRRLMAEARHERYQRAEEVLKGLRELAGQRVQLETTATRESYLRAARFVGREREREQLEQALERALAGRGEAWLVGGESGVGKSRLVEELRTLAMVRGAVVLRGQAVSSGGSPYEDFRPVLPWLALLTEPDDFEASVLKSLVPNLETLLQRRVPEALEISGDIAQERLMSVVEALFERIGQPTLLLLEDQQWGRPESTRLLARLSARAATLPLLVVATYRDDERPGLPQELPAMRVLGVPRLEAEEMARLSESMIGEAGRAPQVLELLLRETEGNPFFLVEVVRALAEEAGQLERIGAVPLPERVFAGGVRQIIQRRLDKVPASARELLRLAAVVGRHLDLAVLRASAPEEDLERWLEDCAGAAVLDFADGRWRFAHDKLREGTLASLPRDEARALHHRAALSIEAAHPHASEWLAALAYHWGQAGDTEREAHYAERAGAQAMSVYACHAAIPYFQRALEIARARAAQAHHIGHLQERLAETFYLIGDTVSCVTHAGQALENLGWPLPRSPRGWRLGLARELLVRLVQATLPESFEEQSPERRKLRIEVGHLTTRLSEIYFFQQNPLRAIWSTFRLVNLLEPAGPSPDLARAYAIMATVLNSIPPLRPRVDAWCERALNMARRVGGADSVIYVLVRCCICGIGQARWKEVGAWVEEARELASTARDFRQFEQVCSMLSNSLYYQGSFRRGVEISHELERSARRRNAVQSLYWGPMQRARCLVRLGHTAEAIRELEQVLPGYEPHANAAEKILLYGSLALALSRGGQRERALEMAAKGFALMRGMRPVVSLLVSGIRMVTEVYLAEWERAPGGPSAEARELARAAKESCKLLRAFARAFPLGEPVSLLCNGQEAWLSGRTEVALRTWRRCAERAVELAMPYEEGRALLELGRHLVPEAPERKAHLLRARELFQRLEAAVDLARTEAELARACNP
ncbi:AAA family ATPase [Vitiosangium sp. GDMCC 1.1324]|uniref:ATP-binding protein n=1 Tax=Vitiosangium sp. (strain GDMCC 1.1324) TaxID=2138576 RepID=UPI000D34BA14|nr:serine/threonine-protein kinase [Vitiosangium sp. GDMCC 1.1324]PTL78448.1 serine/threonine-protein kinase PknK [Vitiosangium sp. GDMCC 1.1324]